MTLPTQSPQAALPPDAPCRLEIVVTRAAMASTADSPSDGLSPLARGVELALAAVDTSGRDTPAALSYQVLDFYGRTVACGNVGRLTVPRGGVAQRTVPLPHLRERGWYQVVAELQCAAILGQALDLQARPVTVRAVKPFQIGSPDGRAAVINRQFVASGPDALATVAARCGIGTFRCDDLAPDGQGVTNWHDRAAEATWQPAFDATAAQRRVAAFDRLNLAIIGRLGPNPLTPTTNDGRLALPRDSGEYAAATVPLVELLGQVTQWDILPADLDHIAATADEIRQLILDRQAALRAARKDVTLWLSGSPQAIDSLFAESAADGREDTGRPTAWADGLRFIDSGASPETAAATAHRMRVARWTQIVPPPHGHEQPQQRAWDVARRIATVVAAGGWPEMVLRDNDTVTPAVAEVAAEMFDGASPASTEAMAAQVWPDLAPQVRSPVFSSARRRMAVIWAEPAADSNGCGAMLIRPARDVVAMDCLGRNVGWPQGQDLLVPLGPAPVYVVTGRMEAAELLRHLRKATVEWLGPTAPLPSVDH